MAEEIFQKIEAEIDNPRKVVIFQFAPSLRVSIGEEFGYPPGTDLTGQLVAALRKLGAKYVFDVSVGADFTTFEEAKEVAMRLEKNENLPVFTSCCPMWVKYVERFWPKLILNLATARSPHIILGGFIKTYFAQKENLPVDKIVVVSVMPCLAKKEEILRPELKIGGLVPVDLVLTTVETTQLFKKYQIDLKNINPETADNPLGISSGSGEFYGASGGVMLAALRTLFENVSLPIPKIEFKETERGIKEGQVNFKGRIIKIAVIYGLDDAKNVLECLSQNSKLYDYIEVMACPGGCIGGTGQPASKDSEIYAKRALGLLKTSQNKKIQSAQNNPIVKEIYAQFLNNENNRTQITQTRYFDRSEEN